MAGDVATAGEAGTGVTQLAAGREELSDQDKPAAGDEVTPVIRMPAAGHAPHLEAPEEFARLLEQFITDLR